MLGRFPLLYMGKNIQHSSGWKQKHDKYITLGSYKSTFHFLCVFMLMQLQMQHFFWSVTNAQYPTYTHIYSKK